MSSCAYFFTVRFGQSLSLSVTQSAFASTKRSAALLSRRMRWCHRDHTPLITRVDYLPALSPCRPGESVLTLLTHSGLSLLHESYIKAPTATSNCRGCMGVKADMPRVKVHKCATIAYVPTIPDFPGKYWKMIASPCITGKISDFRRRTRRPEVT